MKARVKTTGEIVEVFPYNKDGFAYIQDDGETVYELHELEILDDPDYWEKLKHQYAGMAMQGMITDGREIVYLDGSTRYEHIIKTSIAIATALVEKLKNDGVI